METEVTLDTNAQKLPRFVSVGITKENKTLAVFSFATSESQAAFNFFFDVLRDEIFK